MATQGIILDVTLCFFNGVFSGDLFWPTPQLCWGPIDQKRAKSLRGKGKSDFQNTNQLKR